MAGIYLSVAVLLRLPAIQSVAGVMAAEVIGGKLGTRVHVGKVRVGLFNRLIVDDVEIYDQQGAKMLRAGRVSVKVRLSALCNDRIEVYSAQLFGMKARLWRKDSASEPNFQFVLDSLRSDGEEPKEPLNLSIQSLVIRNASFTYDEHDKPRTPGVLNPCHIDVGSFNANVKIDRITDDSLAVDARRLSFTEKSGVEVSSLSFTVNAGHRGCAVRDLKLRSGETHVDLRDFTATYCMKDGKILPGSLTWRCFFAPSSIFLQVDKLTTGLGLNIYDASLSGSDRSVTIDRLAMKSDDGDMLLDVRGSVTGIGGHPRWKADIKALRLGRKSMGAITSILSANKVAVPEVVGRLGSVDFTGKTEGGSDMAYVRGHVKSDVGTADVTAGYSHGKFHGKIDTKGFDVGRLAKDSRFGKLVARLEVSGTTGDRGKDKRPKTAAAKGTVESMTYNGVTYHNISLDLAADIEKSVVAGEVAINDPNGKASVRGDVAFGARKGMNVVAQMERLNLLALGITDRIGSKTIGMTAHAEVSGTSVDDFCGSVTVNDFSISSGGTTNRISLLKIDAGNDADGHYMRLNSDFADAEVRGRYSLAQLGQSVINVIADKVPSMPCEVKGLKGYEVKGLKGLKGLKSLKSNDFSIYLRVRQLGWINEYLGLPFTINKPVSVNGTISERDMAMDLDLDMPDFSMSGNRLTNAKAHVVAMGDSLNALLYCEKTGDNGKDLTVKATAKAMGGQLRTCIDWDTHSKQPLRGRLNAVADFHEDKNGETTANVQIEKSDVMVGDSKWIIQPSRITWARSIAIDNFTVSNGKQYLMLRGTMSNSPSDSLTIDLNGIDVGYALDLVNFHSVTFGGSASGRAVVKPFLNKPEATAHVVVDDFKFEDGRMGVLLANVNYNNREEQIDIDAVANDGERQTIINGYVSPKRNYIDLGIEARNTRLEFLKSFCGSFMDNIQAWGNGHCRVFGDLRDVNIEGRMVADGTIFIKPLGTTYTLMSDTITMIPDEILFDNAVIKDKYGNMGTVGGALHHKSLTRLTFDLYVNAMQMLVLDSHDYGEDTFYGTVFATGNCYIKGRKGEITFDIDATPQKDSFIEYNAASPASIDEVRYITWRDVTYRDSVDADSTSVSSHVRERAEEVHEMASDIKLNLRINATPDFTLRMLMDEQTGDKITLNGTGNIRANYYNKCAFEMFGNYLVTQGTYRLTVQNMIKKEFSFTQGSQIVFSGDPFSSAIDLKGIYTLNAVSLSDLQIGKSFKSNNTKVNCMMNIGGTAGNPSVTFDLDLPTLSTDARQMVKSVINSEEDMNQQVLYLLAVGRFYAPANNNASQETAESRSQTSLAMQSLLSGTISQQINNVLSNFVKSSNWNFGANISTGDEGWNNAEYEGLLSGRLMNNRLLINGEFGYRDNVNDANESNFIGDFDIRYLLFPSGNLAVRVYNQTNDRYFTRNSLNTQGLGIIMKRDFNSLGELFGGKKKPHPK